MCICSGYDLLWKGCQCKNLPLKGQSLTDLINKYGFGKKYRYLNREDDWFFIPEQKYADHTKVFRGLESNGKRSVWGTEGDPEYGGAGWILIN